MCQIIRLEAGVEMGEERKPIDRVPLRVEIEVVSPGVAFGCVLRSFHSAEIEKLREELAGEVVRDACLIDLYVLLSTTLFHPL